MKVLLDMNLSPRWVETLRQSGVEADHWSALGAANAPDVELMAYARVHGHVVLTHDLDFSAILAATHGDRPSVVQIRMADVRPEAIGTLVVDALRQMAASLAEGALVTIGPQSTRLRLLPLYPRPSVD